MVSLLQIAKFVILFFPIIILPENGEFYYSEHVENYLQCSGHVENRDDENDNEDEDNVDYGHNVDMTLVNSREWYEQEIYLDAKWCLAIDRVDFAGSSAIGQHLTVISTKRFGKALVIDGLLQTSQLDEYIYHENLVHPALLTHNKPKTVFIMGGGEGSAAREVLKHKHIEKVIICEIDKEVVNLCRQHMITNHEAFNDERFEIIFNDVKDELNKCEEKFDVILGDLCDPDESSSSMNLYTKYFYERVVKQKLKKNGIFATQAGPAGIFFHKTVFSVVYNTLKQVFTYVVGYTTHIPSYGDFCGFIMASDEPIIIDAEQLNNMIGERIRGELRYLDGPIIAVSTVLNKNLKKSLMEETRVLTNENVRFVRGRQRHRI